MKYDVILQIGEKCKWRCMKDEPGVAESISIVIGKWYEATIVTTFSSALTLSIINEDNEATNVPHYSIGQWNGFSEIEIPNMPLAIERMRLYYLNELAAEQDRHKREMDKIQAQIDALYVKGTELAKAA